ncbi:MAG: hypothetical protein HS115_12785 [Spirochaetales bacterium]|nr:hypothetical protein [Spirochaetales bacterium]
MSYLTALLFLIQSQFERYLPHERKSVQLKTKAGELLTDIYVPRFTLRWKNRPRGVVLFIHGMSLMGKDDLRAVNICRALAGVGFLCFAPAYDEIAGLEMTTASIGRIRETIRTLTSDPAICPGGQINVFTASFSAGFALTVAGEKDMASRVQTLFLVGPPGEIQSTAHALLGQEGVDMYGAFIFFKNFIYLSDGKRSPLIRAFELAARDNWHNRPGMPELEAYLKKQPRAVRKRFELLCQSAEERLRTWKSVFPREKTGVLTLDILGSTARLKTRSVYLLHGSTDDVIPPGQSELLSKRLEQNGKRHRLIISPLITHGDAAIKPSLFIEILRLLNVFADFFSQAESRSR